MSKIVVFLEPDSASRAAVVEATRKHLDVGIEEIADRLGAERPLVEVELFGNDHDEPAGGRAISARVVLAVLARGQGTLTGTVTGAVTLSIDGNDVTIYAEDGGGQSASRVHQLVVDTQNPQGSLTQTSSPVVGSQPVQMAGRYFSPTRRR